jgi:hypothetical protein
VWTLNLDKAAGGKPMSILLLVADGQVKQSACMAETYNRAAHDIDAAGLKVSAAGITGSVKLTINPDEWVPPDHKAVECEFELELAAQNGKVTGGYKGRFGPVPTRGEVSGTVQAAPDASLARQVEVRMENALAGEQGHHRRLTLTFDLKDGKPTSAKVVGFHPTAWRGKVEAIDATLSERGLKGQFSASIAAGVVAVGEGLYTFDVDATVVGPTIVGRFKAKLKDKDLPAGAFVGTIQYKPASSRRPPDAPPATRRTPATAAAPVAGATDTQRTARAQAIAQTLATIDEQAKAQGGWEAWYARIQPFQEDLKRIIRDLKWPWPAKKDFVFYGKSAELLMIEGWDKHPARQDPFAAIVSLDRQIKERGVDLIFVPIPDKLSIHPDYLSEKAPADRMVSVQTKQLLKRLCEADVEVVDLFTVYHAFRKEHGDDVPLYYTRDGHWNNRGAQIAGDQIGQRLARYDFVQKAIAAGNPFEAKKGSRSDGVKADDNLRRILKKDGGIYQDASGSPIVLTGDSFSMYNMGQNAAHLPAQVALNVAMPLAYVCREGLAQDMPVELARLQSTGRYLNGRRVLIWTVRGRCLAEKGWTAVDLSGKRWPQPMVADVAASATVAGLSPGPAKDAPYVNYIMEIHVKDLKDAKGAAIGQGEGILHVLAMRDRKILPVADTKAGQTLNVRLTTWSTVKERYDKINAGVIADSEVAISRPEFWAEMAEEAPATGPAPGPKAVE